MLGGFVTWGEEFPTARFAGKDGACSNKAGRTLRRTPYETFATFVRSFENWFVRRYK